MYLEAHVPTVEDIDRIAALEDAVVRNLQITQCYHELSAVLMERLGENANWCTFATWASKQAGQTIRKDDLARFLEGLIAFAPKVRQRLSIVAQSPKNGVRNNLDEFSPSGL
jgi:hypothetical protein